MYENYEDIFLDETFYSAPKCIYQILIIRVSIKNTNKNIATFFSSRKNKKETCIKLILIEINKKLNFNNDKLYHLQ